MQEFHYRFDWRASSAFPGHHRSTHGGAGLDARGHAPLASAGDARRLDLYRSLRDPFSRWMVRMPQQRSAISVAVLADLSASMGFVGRMRKMHELASFVAAAGYSAFRTGDAFTFIGCDETLRQEFFLPASRAKGAGLALAERLRAFVPAGASCDGLLRAATHLSGRRSLVFLVSDFHFPLATLARLLDALRRHAVVPVVLWDEWEHTQFRRPGFCQVRDPETGRRRLLFLRPGLAARIEANYAARRSALQRLFRERELRPLMIENGFRAEAVTAYFLQGRDGCTAA